MQLRLITAPPSGQSSVSWRDLYRRGRFIQRDLEGLNRLRQLAQERGLPLALGNSTWESWDELGALAPIAFGSSAWHSGYLLDPDAPDTIAFREEEAFRDWASYAYEVHGHQVTQPLYSPWQLLPLHDVIHGQIAEVPVGAVGDREQRETWFETFEDWYQGQHEALQGLDAAWASALKFLVEIQNRFWPVVSARVVLPFHPVSGERIDPMPQEVSLFEPVEVMDRHGLDEGAVAQLYEWLVERGARLEAGLASLQSIGGDHWARLRQLADRRERAQMRGPALGALDFYDAAEMINRFWQQHTGMCLPGVAVAPYRRTTKPIDHDATAESPFERTRDALRDQLVAHGLWPGRIHVIVEGETEEMWVQRLVEALLGFEPSGLLLTNLHGVGSAPSMGEIVEAAADYASYAAFVVDREGQMAKYIASLVTAGAVDPSDVLLVDPSFEEMNFSDEELVRCVQAIASDPPWNRPAVAVHLTARELRAGHNKQLSRRGSANQPGLAGTLLEMLRWETVGPVNLSKLELAKGLLEMATNELETAGLDQAENRPIIRFVAERIANPLANLSWH